jgi:GNAT superfamily N-acetyltransferase
MTPARVRDAVATLCRTPRLLIAQKALRRLPFRPVDIGKLCFLRLDRVPHVPSWMLRGNAGVRSATPEDLEALVCLQDKEAVFVERFKRGERCVVAEVDGDLIGYEWFSDKAVHHESAWGCPITIPGGFVYAYDAYIDPAYRNTGVWLRFKAYLGEWMTARGKRGVLTFVEYGNWPSLRTHLRFGFEPTESVLALKILGLKLFRTVRAISKTSWSYLAYLLINHGHAAAHHAVRALHFVAIRR